MAGLGKKTFVAGDVLTASDVNGYLMEQSVMVFAGTATRNAAITTPTEGMFSFQKDTDQLTYYDGSNWDVMAPLDSPTFTGTVTAASPTFTGTVNAAAITATGNIDGAIVSGTTVAASGRGVLVRQPSGDATAAILQFTNNAVSAQRAAISADSASLLTLSATTVALSVTSANINGARIGGVVGGSGTTTSGSNLTVTHGLGATPTAVTANARSNTYSATLNTNIYVGNIGATTFTVFANNGAGGAVAAAFNWMAVS